MIKIIKKYKKAIKVIIIIAIIIAAVLALAFVIHNKAEANATVTTALTENGDYILFHESDNWYNDDKINVKWVTNNNPEPHNINVRINEQVGDEFQYACDFDLIEGQEKTITLPHSGGKFQVEAKASEGSGNVTLHITSNKE
jgi:hypothetical protein